MGKPTGLKGKNLEIVHHVLFRSHGGHVVGAVELYKWDIEQARCIRVKHAVC